MPPGRCAGPDPARAPHRLCALDPAPPPTPPPPPQWSWPFNAPVDLRQYPDYLALVAHPMDFGTIKRRIDAGCAGGGAGGYRHPDEFLADVRLVFDNARLYNKPGSDVHVMANTLQVCGWVWWRCVWVGGCGPRAGLLGGRAGGRRLHPARRVPGHG